jgi:hypothetical protein
LHAGAPGVAGSRAVPGYGEVLDLLSIYVLPGIQQFEFDYVPFSTTNKSGIFVLE